MTEPASSVPSLDTGKTTLHFHCPADEPSHNTDLCDVAIMQPKPTYAAQTGRFGQEHPFEQRFSSHINRCALNRTRVGEPMHLVRCSHEAMNTVILQRRTHPAATARHVGAFVGMTCKRAGHRSACRPGRLPIAAPPLSATRCMRVMPIVRDSLVPGGPDGLDSPVHSGPPTPLAVGVKVPSTVANR